MSLGAIDTQTPESQTVPAPGDAQKAPLEALSDGQGEAAFLLRPVTVKQIENWANDRRRMPPKTTVRSSLPLNLGSAERQPESRAAARYYGLTFR